MPNPSGLTYAKVVGNFKSFFADTADGDDLPDFADLEGYGTITADVLEARNRTIGNTGIYLPEPMDVVVNNSVLGTAGTSTYVNVVRGVNGVTPIDFTYTLTLNLRRAGTNNEYKKYGPFSFLPTPDPLTNVVDLALMIPVTTSQGTPITIGPTGLSGVAKVLHGMDANVARPTTADLVYWIGSAKPNNALPYDWWYNG